MPKQWYHGIRINWGSRAGAADQELQRRACRPKVCPDERKVVSYTAKDGHNISFAIEAGRLVKYVDDQKQVGSTPNDGIVTKLTINLASPYDVRDQHGSGSSDYPEMVVVWLREMTPEVDVPVEGNVWWATLGPVIVVSSPSNLKDSDVLSDGDDGDVSTRAPSKELDCTFEEEEAQYMP